MGIQKLIKKVKLYRPKADIKLIKKAYDFAKKAHKSQKRLDGSPYITHTVEVATILSELGLDEDAICAGLLHDVLEDTDVTQKDLQRSFSKDILDLVDGVTKISNINKISATEQDAKSLIKIMLATAKDIRVMMIKLADRLHNMRTLKYLPEKSRIKNAKETKEIYAPIAYRFGLIKIKSELEDLSLKYLEPKEYRILKKKIDAKKASFEKTLIKTKQDLIDHLKQHSISAQIEGRIKSVYSVYKKIHQKNIPFESINDLIALRIITRTIKDCYETLGVVHNMYKHVPGTFKDYIAIPKENLYQSLHTVVLTPEGHPIEVQIKTNQMHTINEEGISAHFKYKGSEIDKKFDKRLSWLKQILDYKSNLKNTKELIENLKLDIMGNEMYVFTPKGDVIELPSGATPIDFAYAIHSGIGDHASGATVNGKFVSLDHHLENGDIVNILTIKNHYPSREWLKFTKTAKARHKIKARLRELGKSDLTPKHHQIQEINKVTYDSILKLKGVKDPVILFAKCCDPLPNDSIIGYKTKLNKINIHKKDCINIKNNSQPNKVEVSWIEQFDSEIKIEVLAQDRIGLMADLLNNIANTGTNVSLANAKIIQGNQGLCSFVTRIKSLEQLNNIIKHLKKVNGVKKVSIAAK